MMKRYILIVCWSLMATLPVMAQKSISGVVTNNGGAPLAGVSIAAGQQDATLSGPDGTFTVEVDAVPVTIVFNTPGFKQLELEFEKVQLGVIVVLEDAIDMEYVAYGKKPKDQVTGSIYSISGEDIVSNRSTNLMIALQGRLPGLRVIQNSGEPGRESFDAHIRGYDSPTSNGILYIVDGVERIPFGINPEEIERVTILKDAAATAMYGMRGSGGVLLIDTKKGFVGKSKINVSVDHAIQSPTRLPKFASAYDYTNMYNQRQANDTLYDDRQDIASGGSGIDHRETSFYSPHEIERYRLGDSTEFYPVRNVVDDFMKDFSQLTRVNVSFQGGSELMRFYTSVGYLHQGGLFETEPFDKYSYDAESKTDRVNFRTNMEMSLNETLDMWVNIGGYLEKNNRPRIGGGWGWDYVLAKLYETPNNAYNDLTPDGEVLVKRDKLDFRDTHSVYGYLNRTGAELETATKLGNTFGLRQKLDGITPGLSATAQLAFDVYSRSTQIRDRDYEAWEVASLSDVNGIDSIGYTKVPGTSNTTLSDGHNKFFLYMYNFRGSLDYRHTFGSKHHVTAMLMGERHMQQMQALQATNYMGLAGRAAYAYNNRYFAEANFSYQGSEQFAKGNRFGFFPSLSAGWLLSQEDFLKNSNILTYLKLRASVGQTGNSVFNYGADNQYLYLNTWNNNATENQLGNENISWETSTKYNVGVETEFLNALTFGADFFYHKNTDVILRDIDLIPNGMMGLGGASLPPLNIGETKNQGFELIVGYDKKFSKDFSLNVNGNVSFSKNEQTYMAELPYDNTYAYAYRKKGYPINYNWGYKTDGLFNSQAEIDDWYDQSNLGGVPIPGDIKYMDLTGDGKVDEKDKAPLSRGQAPELVFGLRVQAAYKWFDVNVFFNGAARRSVYLHGFGRWSNNDNFTDYMKEAWTPERAASGQEIVYPRLGKNSTNYIASDYWIEDGSYLRLRNVELGFTLPASLSSRINASTVRFYVNGLNLAVWDKLPNDDYDPETANSQNIDYPIVKAFNFGVNVKF